MKLRRVAAVPVLSWKKLFGALTKSGLLALCTLLYENYTTKSTFSATVQHVRPILPLSFYFLRRTDCNVPSMMFREYVFVKPWSFIVMYQVVVSEMLNSAEDSRFDIPFIDNETSMSIKSDIAKLFLVFCQISPHFFRYTRGNCKLRSLILKKTVAGLCLFSTRSFSSTNGKTLLI